MSSLLDRYLLHPDLHQSPSYKEMIGYLGWQALGQPGNYIYVRQLGPLKIAKCQRPSSLTLTELNSYRQNHHFWFTYYEPGLNQLPIESGFRSEPFAHSASSLIDLSLSPDELLATFKPKTRYNIRYALKKQVISTTSTPLGKLTANDQTTFLALHSRWSRRKQVYGYDDKLLKSVLRAFRAHGHLHTANYQGQSVAALLVLYHGQVATYYAAFADPIGYRHFAPTLLTWLALNTAQESGSTIFDFGGIYDARYPKMYKKWQGFSKFKEGFSPTPITYPPTRFFLGW